jgi:putative Mg2+ transporter-C (MgtC) family protein
MIDWGSIGDTFLRLTSATVLGGVIGLEREMRDRWAGMRTHMMVAMGAAVFVEAAQSAVPGEGADVSRTIQGVAAGIGFIGAGTILKLTERQEVKGLTTASSIWLAAAVGTTCGLALYSIAVIGTVLAVLVLAVLLPLESWLQRKNQGK